MISRGKDHLQIDEFRTSIYPLVNVYIAMWKNTMFYMGKSTISMAIFNTLWWTNIAMENHHFQWENPL